MERPVRELTYDVRSLRDAVRRRGEVRVAYTDKISRTVIRNDDLKRIRIVQNADAATTATKKEKKEEAERALKVAKTEAIRWNAEFDSSSRRLLREIDRFGAEFRDKVRAAVYGWASVQMEFYSEGKDAWGRMLPALEEEKEDRGGEGQGGVGRVRSRRRR